MPVGKVVSRARLVILGVAPEQGLAEQHLPTRPHLSADPCASSTGFTGEGRSKGTESRWPTSFAAAGAHLSLPTSYPGLQPTQLLG